MLFSVLLLGVDFLTSLWADAEVTRFCVLDKRLYPCDKLTKEFGFIYGLEGDALDPKPPT